MMESTRDDSVVKTLMSELIHGNQAAHDDALLGSIMSGEGAFIEAARDDVVLGALMSEDCEQDFHRQAARDDEALGSLMGVQYSTGSRVRFAEDVMLHSPTHQDCMQSQRLGGAARNWGDAPPWTKQHKFDGRGNALHELQNNSLFLGEQAPKVYANYRTDDDLLEALMQREGACESRSDFADEPGGDSLCQPGDHVVPSQSSYAGVNQSAVILDYRGPTVSADVPDELRHGLGGGIYSALLERGNAGTSRWVFVGPRDPWRTVGLSSLSFQALEDVGCGGSCDLLEAAQATDVGARYPGARNMLRTNKQESRQQDGSGQQDPDHDADPATALLKQFISEWGRGAETAIVDRLARVGGTIIIVVRGTAFERWRHAGQLPDARLKTRLRLDPSGPSQRVSVRVSSPALMRHIVSSLSDQLILASDIVLVFGELLKRGWRLLPTTSAGDLDNKQNLLQAKLPLTLWFDVQPGLAVAQTSRVPVPEEPALMMSTAKVTWPPAVGLRVQRYGAAVGESFGTVICSGRTGWSLIRWDGDDEYEQVHVSNLQVLDDTMEFLARVHKFRSPATGVNANSQKHGTSLQNGHQSRPPDKTETADDDWRLLVASCVQGTDGIAAGNGNLSVWDLTELAETDRTAASPILVPAAVLLRCAEQNGDAPAALLMARCPSDAQAALQAPMGGIQSDSEVTGSSRFRVGDVVLVDPKALPKTCAGSASGSRRKTSRKPPLARARVAAVSGRREVGLQLADASDETVWVHASRVYNAGPQ